jgi:hypothetical protein
MTEELITTKKSSILEELENIPTSNPSQQELVKQANSAFGLLSSIPMICRADNCSYCESCPVHGAELAIEGNRCPIETDLVRNMFISYCNELNINPDTDKVQAGLVKDLCSVEIQALRANKVMSFADVIVDVVDSIDQRSGTVYYKKDLHIAVLWSEKLLAQKVKILDTLAATPLVKLRYEGGTKTESLLDRISSLKKKMEAMMPKDMTENETFDVEGWKEE